jgi:hypothetical protein
MALMVMPLAHGDLTMNHLVSEKWPCLTMVEKARVKSKDSSAKFHWSHFREINNVGVGGVHVCICRTSQIISVTRWQSPPLKHMAFQEELRIF